MQHYDCYALCWSFFLLASHSTTLTLELHRARTHTVIPLAFAEHAFLLFTPHKATQIVQMKWYVHKGLNLKIARQIHIQFAFMYCKTLRLILHGHDTRPAILVPSRRNCDTQIFRLAQMRIVVCFAPLSSQTQ